MTIQEQLPEDLAPEESIYETDYETGQDNVDFLGLDLHNPVFFISAAMILSFILVSLQKVSQICASLGWSIILRIPATLDRVWISNGIFLQ